MDAVIVRVGSDASYDLIMEALPKNGKVECSLLVTDEELIPRAREIFEGIKTRIVQESKFSLRLHLFQRMPDPWVWTARLDALIEKFDRKMKGEVLPWL
ncbi:MAG: hypothetical protein Q8J86_09360 [Desulfurivibrionaceae bacterium]|jgi:hypothetical protein|nr:hypothetical protein [Desulfurivibrionaceae bacterium]